MDGAGADGAGADGAGAVADLVAAVRASLAEQADPQRAVGQQRYMKSTMPYLGLSSPTLRRTLRPLYADRGLALPDRVAWDGAIRTLWDEATHREHRYAAIALGRHRRYAAWVDSTSMPLWRHLVETGAWWDLVDDVATHLVRAVLAREPVAEATRLRQWARDPDLWVRRTAIICQVGRRDALDRELLTDAIEANLDDRDFFIRKAIGWALRDHARIDPGWVQAFVDARPRLSGLSRREALKHVAPE